MLCDFTSVLVPVGNLGVVQGQSQDATCVLSTWCQPRARRILTSPHQGRDVADLEKHHPQS